MEFKDYYSVLGVDRDASQDEIRRAYRKLARKFHPDVSKESDAETRFKDLGEAYEVLKDPEKRAAYDQLGGNWKGGQDFRPPPGWDQGFEFHGGADSSAFSDFFRNLFGGGGFGHGGPGGAHDPGQDTHAKILVGLEDAYHGATRKLSLKHTELGPDGRPQVSSRTLNVRIPKGVRPGQLIRLAGQGGAGRNHAGDLYLEVEFQPHPLFQIEGRDVILNLPVTPWEAALGAKVPTPTPSGNVDLTVPAGSKGGSRLRLKGRGIPSDPPGDLYAVLRIALPPADDETVKTAYRDFAAAAAFDPRLDLAGHAA